MLPQREQQRIEVVFLSRQNPHMPSKPTPTRTRKSTKNKTSRTRKPSRAKVRDLVTLALVAGDAFGDVVELVAGKLGIENAEARSMVGEVRQAIIIAAGADRVGELRGTLDRLDDLYTDARTGVNESAAAKNVALNVLKERARLLGLHGAASEQDLDEDSGESPAERELAAIAAHLLPLKLVASGGVPLVEHARIAADVIRRSQA
jgi:hypothetical protein